MSRYTAGPALHRNPTVASLREALDQLVADGAAPDDRVDIAKVRNMPGLYAIAAMRQGVSAR
jgi:hypothetical protein